MRLADGPARRHLVLGIVYNSRAACDRCNHREGVSQPSRRSDFFMERRIRFKKGILLIVQKKHELLTRASIEVIVLVGGDSPFAAR